MTIILRYHYRPTFIYTNLLMVALNLKGTQNGGAKPPAPTGMAFCTTENLLALPLTIRLQKA
jgi:hypothetical protein